MTQIKTPLDEESKSGVVFTPSDLPDPLIQISTYREPFRPVQYKTAPHETKPLCTKTVTSGGLPLAFQGVRFKVRSELNKLTPNADKCADTERINDVDNSVVVLGHSLATSYLWHIR